MWDRLQHGAIDDSAGANPGHVAPGKRTLTANLHGGGAVQLRSAGGANAAAPLTPHEDPFALHLAAAPAVQREAAGPAAAMMDDPGAVHLAAQHGVSGSGGGLPHADIIQQSFGHHDVSGVRAHVGGAAAEASAAIGAEAYATGDDVAFRAAPDLRQAAHEAAHVVQQRGGVRLDGGVGRVGDPYEQHADQVAELVVRGESAEAVLDTMAHRGAGGGDAVQRWANIGTEIYPPAVTPMFGDNVARVPIHVGSEAEWRAALADDNENVWVISFLRAAYVPADEFAAHAERWMHAHPTLRWMSLAPALPRRGRRELTRQPSHAERLRLAKALYMRGNWALADMQTEGLMSQLIAECQADVLDLAARGGHTITPGAVERAATFAGREATEQMIGSAGGSLLEGIGRFLEAAGDPDRRAEADRLIRLAGYTVRGAVSSMDDDYAAERAAMLAMVEGAFSMAMSGLPSPIRGTLRGPSAALSNALVDAVCRPSPGAERLEVIQRGATNMIVRFDYAAAGVSPETQGLLRSAVDSSIM